MYILRERIKSGKYLQNGPYGFTGGYMTDKPQNAMPFETIDQAIAMGKTCYGMARLTVVNTITGAIERYQDRNDNWTKEDN